MEKDKFIKTNSEKMIFIVSSILLFILVLRSIDKFSTITIVGDEFGYWATAAKFAGYDWSGIASNLPYYSYGYGILLTPLYWIFDNPKYMYRTAIILNGLMLCGIYTFSCVFLKHILNGINNKRIMLMAWTASSFSGLLLYSYCAWTEIPICFFYMMLIVVLLKVCEKARTIDFVLVAFIGIFIYQIHQRNLGILIALILCIFIMYMRQDIHKKHMVSFLLAFIAIFIIHYFIKEYLMNYLWRADMNAMASLNDYSGQVGKIKTLFSMDGIYKLLNSVIGKIYYIGASSSFISFLGISVMIKLLWEKFCTKNDNGHNQNTKKMYVYLFLLLSFTFSLGIAAISMMEPARVDTVVYGRYLDAFVIPLLLIGLGEVENCDRPKKEGFILIFLILIVSIKVYFILGEYGVTDYFYNCVPGISYFWINGHKPYTFILINTVINVIICIFIFYMKYGRGNRILVTTMIIIMTNLISGITLQNDYLKRQDKYSENYKTVKSIENVAQNNSIYVVGMEDSSTEFWIDCSIIQFMMYDKTFRVLNTEDTILKENDILLVSNNEKYLARIPSEYQILDKNNSCVALICTR